MFSNGQWIFGVLFALVFTIVLVIAYRRDRSLHKRYYKGTVWILLAFITFIAFIAFIKFLFL